MQRTLVVVAALVLAFAGCAVAGSSDTLTIHYQVIPITEVALSEQTVDLLVDSSASGDEVKTATASATYDLTTNVSEAKLSGSIDGDLPAGVSLSAELAAPEGATGCGEVMLGTAPADLISGVSPVAQSSLGVTFRLTAGVDAGLVEPSQTVFTLTVTDR